MRAIAVSSKSKTLNTLLRKARRKSVILEAADGERFMLTSLKDWEVFEVGEGNGFAAEARRTAKNKDLAQVMKRRRVANQGKPRSRLGDLRARLGVE